MSVEEVLREVEKQLGELDERAKEAVKLALKLAQGEVAKVADLSGKERTLPLRRWRIWALRNEVAS
jgi:hypothetical protein